MTTRRAFVRGIMAAPVVLAAGQLAPPPPVGAQQGPGRIARPATLFGLHVPGASAAALAGAEAQAGRQADAVLVFGRLDAPGVNTVRALQLQGYEVALCLEWWDRTKQPNDPRYRLGQIAAGAHDAAAAAWWELIADLPAPVHLRPLHEGNGHWYPWAAYNGRINRPEEYVAAYRHVVEQARAVAGPDRIRAQWCINRKSSTSSSTPFAATYPGDDVVDEFVLNGYNRPELEVSASFDELFRPPYEELKSIDPGRPLWIGETASTERRGDKAAWIEAMFATIRSSMVIDVLSWFHETVRPGGGALLRDYPFDTSPASLEAFRRGITRTRGV